MCIRLLAHVKIGDNDMVLLASYVIRPQSFKVYCSHVTRKNFRGCKGLYLRISFRGAYAS